MSESGSSPDVDTSSPLGQSQRMKGQRLRTELRTELLAEVDRLLEIAADKLPASQQSPRNQRHQRAMQKQLVRYFRKVEAAFPYRTMAAIYNRYVED